MIQLDLIKAPQSWALLLIGVAIFVFRRTSKKRTEKGSPLPLIPIKKPQPEYSEDAYSQIEPLRDFDLENEEPIKIRPFKPKYHLTMAIENTTMSDLIAMDKTYPTRIALRSQLIREKQQDVLAFNPIIAPAVLEFYSWLVNTYLPQRFPTIFTLSPTSLLNSVTNSTLPLHPHSPEEALKLIGANIDDDFLFLLPISEPGSDHGKYRLEGFITCFPSGFNTPAKLNLKLADIHAPVPGYAAKLEKSMDRFFASLPVGRIVKRHNWSMTTNTKLHLLAGNHMSEEELAAKQKQEGDGGSEEEDEVDLRQTVLRCERQTLHRLPRSKALVFAFKTYQYWLQELKDEGCGEELAGAIDGLGMGSVPGMTVYKRQVVWGEKVKRFLRGEIGIDGEAVG